MDTQSRLENFIQSQQTFEERISKKHKGVNGSFFTNSLKTIDKILDIIDINNILKTKILEPSCGHGIFLLRLISKTFEKFLEKETIDKLIENCLIFIDIDPNMIEKTKSNINQLYHCFFGENYSGKYNGYVYDFTNKLIQHDLFFEIDSQKNDLLNFLEKIDYVIGNPPYVTLYGRRDKKKNESQRIYYLKNYEQFPFSLKNGKINYVMLFIEHSLDFLKKNGKLSFIVDLAFFETAYLYIRKYLLEKTRINSLEFNITDFEVASGQLILKLSKDNNNKDQVVKLIDGDDGRVFYIKQVNWDNPKDEYRFRINQCDKTEKIIKKIYGKNDKTLEQLYPKKNLRTCVMLLDMENKFIFKSSDLRTDLKVYPYYQGSKSLKEKFGKLEFQNYFYYDKLLQDKINDKLKTELESIGIKNKKRLGLGETIIYDNPKVYFRQSAKEIIATYDEQKSAANNSLYVFSLRSNSKDIRNFLKFICGLFNSDLITFYAQKENIIRYLRGKQPQIKISDLYSIRIPSLLQQNIALCVDELYKGEKDKEEVLKEINSLIYNYYNITMEEIYFIQKSIKAF